MLKHTFIHRALSHALHLLLGLGNDICSKHEEHAQKIIEK